MPTYNKIVVNGEEILNLDNDTVSSTSQVMNGVTFHLNDGSSAVGSGVIADEYSIGGSLTSNEPCSYKISDSATSITASRFRNYTNLTGIIAPNVETIGDYAFSRCTGLTSISLPQATSIGGDAFYRCIGLTSISLPQATSIGNRVFDNCTGLTSISLPQATSIGIRVFDSCTNLTSITIKNGVNIAPSSSVTCKIATLNNHLYWQKGESTNNIYISNAVAGSPAKTKIGTLTSSNPSLIYTDGPYTITFARTGTDDDFSISWTETP